MSTDESTPANADHAPQPDKPAGRARTRIAPKWALKTIGFGVLCFGFGLYGLFDAIYAYPNRGRKVAEYQLYKHLEAAQDTGMLRQSVLRLDDPAAERTRLREMRETQRSNFENTRLLWLNAWNNLWNLEGAREAMEERLDDSPFVALDELGKKWENISPPAGLALYDLPLQWAIFGVFTPLGLRLFWIYARSASKVYEYDPATHTLYLPDGQSVAAADLTEVDKTKWHKFYVTLERADAKPVPLDLLKYTHLEDWVLEMERVRFPERAEESPEAAPDQTRDQDQVQTQDPDREGPATP